MAAVPSTSSSDGWPEYYSRQVGRPPRPLLLAALQRCPTTTSPRLAVDLGCGDGADTLALLRAGWQVLAVDKEAAAIELLLGAVPREDRPRLEVRVADFTETELPTAELIYCGWSLPHCPAGRFLDLWWRLRASLAPAGRLAGQVLGPRDSWAVDPATAYVSPAQLDVLLDGLDIERLEEVDDDRDSFDGPKHWHYFEIIARRLAPE